MNKYIVFLTIIALSSCGPEPQSRHISYQNIIVLSDMSSRLDNRPQKDLAEIYELLDYFRDECVKPGEKIGDKSCFSFYTFSARAHASIDLNQIENLSDKQHFVNSTGKFKNRGLKQRLTDVKRSIAEMYSKVRNPGLDLISALMDKIETQNIIKNDTILSDGVDSIHVSFDNHIYIFTDGYLEYRNRRKNHQFYFGEDEINKVRRYCVTNSVDIETALNMNRDFCLPVCKSKKNPLVTLHILETHERDKNEKLQTYFYPTGQRDNEILEAVWKKWAKESGFKKLEWKKY